jgi:hypothetical protein
MAKKAEAPHNCSGLTMTRRAAKCTVLDSLDAGDLILAW